MSGGGVPTQHAQQASKTAEPAKTVSPVGEKNKRLSASLLTRSFAEPSLSEPGLLGLIDKGKL